MNSVDAIVVPAARPGQHLGKHIQLAEVLGCTLVILCSRQIDASAVVDEARFPGINVIAIDFDKSLDPLGPDAFSTSELLLNTPFQQHSDLSAKRNTALLLSHYAGWDRVFFLDDDTLVEDPGHIQTAAELLNEYAVVGLTINGFPDASVSSHAYQRLGNSPQSS